MRRQWRLLLPFTVHGGQYYNWFYLKNLLADDTYCGGGGRGDNSNYEMINEYRFSTASTVVAVLSADCTILFTCPILLWIVWNRIQTLKRVVGEAKTARAWAMTNSFPMGPVPFADHVLGADEYQLPNGDIPLCGPG